MTTPVHVDYPHTPGRLYDCPACEAACHCVAGKTYCVYSGPHTYVTVSDVFVAECPDHGMPRRIGRPGDTIAQDDGRPDGGRPVPDHVFRCDGCTREDQTLDPRDIMLEAHESWHVTPDGRLVVVVWDPVTDDDSDTDDYASVFPDTVTVADDLTVTVHDGTPGLIPGTPERAAAYGDEPTHTPAAEYDPVGGHGYPWRPSCSCGWRYGRRYVSADAAAGIASAHADGSLS